MPLQATSGAASYDAFGGGVAAVPQYIEDVFSTFLYTGTGTSVNRTITNGIDLASNGGIVWTKSRSADFAHVLNSTALGFSNYLVPNSTGGLGGSIVTMTANSDGYTMNDTNGSWNNSATTFASWTFRKQPKFFDVVTYTGDGVAGRTVAHNLGSVPGCIIVKKTSSADAWAVYHRGVNSDTGNGVLVLSSTAAQNTNGRFWWGDNTNFIAPTSTNFTVATDGQVNENGATYVAYLFAHNAGGFGLTGTDNVISCGSFTTGSNGKMSAPVDLGYEPQWLLVKRSVATENWVLYDTMRGLDYSGYKVLYPNLSNAEDSSTTPLVPTATGFDTPTANGPFANSTTYIYIAIRRGPMAVPTTGTSVFDAVTYSGDSTSNRLITSPSFPTDLMVGMARNQTRRKYFWDRLRGASVAVDSTTTDAEYSTGTALSLTSVQNGFVVTDNGAPYTNTSGNNYDSLCFRRAPGFFDEVCYTGTGSGVPNTVAHNLAVAPELIIFKLRSSVSDWPVLGVSGSISMALNANFASPTYGTFPLSSVSSTSFTTGSGYTGGGINDSGSTIVAYLFATCPGVSKVGSYTGNGTTQVINCGFTAGSRFVLIKRTDSTGDWYVWDSARGIVAGNDPYLLLNSTAAEVTTTDAVDTDPTGFVVNRLVAVDINENGGTYIFLAIA
jgi:hypothetical protein